LDGSRAETAFVEFDRVQKSYDGISLVVKDLSLSMPKGEFLTMLGPSGSGKTTTLMMLAGFETATHGEIRLNGRPINQVPPHRRGIGMVFQNYALFPHMSVGENLAFPLEVRGIGKSDREAKIRRALDMVQMGGFANRRPAQLSGGQQQRIALARALVFDPVLVLMDEPLGALDKQLREHMQFEIKALHERLGITVVYVTHDQGEALTMSDRVAVFNDGVAPADIYKVLKTPEGVDRAFAKLDTIKDSVVWWEAGAQPPQLLADGEVVMTTAYNGRIFNAAVVEGKPFQIVWDGQIYENEMYVIPKGAPNKDQAMEFVKFATSTDGLRAQAQNISYGPARKSAMKEELIFKDGKTVMAPNLPTAPENMTNSLETSFEFWVDRDAELNERFSAWLAG
jgi:putative spermidine/putrescine transport system ATP-binding protein